MNRIELINALSDYPDEIEVVIYDGYIRDIKDIDDNLNSTLATKKYIYINSGVRK